MSRAIAIDAGNSRVKFGLLDFVALGDKRPTCHADFFIPLREKPPIDRLHEWIENSKEPVDHILLSGSNPPVIESIEQLCQAANLPDTYRVTRELPISIEVDVPEKVGMDRLLNAIGVNASRESNRSAIVVSCGTACTVDYVNPSGIYCGGSILPGFEMSAKALNHYTELLPYVPVEELKKASRKGLGKNTLEALRSGIFWGQVGAVRELVSRLSEFDLEQQTEPPELYLTGGGSHVLAPEFPDGKWVPYLTLQGIVIAAVQQLA